MPYFTTTSSPALDAARPLQPVVRSFPVLAHSLHRQHTPVSASPGMLPADHSAREAPAPASSTALAVLAAPVGFDTSRLDPAQMRLLISQLMQQLANQADIAPSQHKSPAKSPVHSGAGARKFTTKCKTTTKCQLTITQDESDVIADRVMRLLQAREDRGEEEYVQKHLVEAYLDVT